MWPGIGRVAVAFLAIVTLSAVPLRASSQEPSPVSPAQPYGAAELDQLLAPIALYPDTLLGQVLMASTYPLEVVEAARWIQDPAYATLTGDALASALEPLEWDPSVKTLVPFPSVLQMMSSHIDWMQTLGDAFLAQQADVMDAVQRLRRQALAAGTLISTPQQTVTDEDGIIYIETASQDVVYVPAYDPGVVYVPWPYPDYPPYFFPPLSGYYYGPLVTGIQFSIGFYIVRPFWGWHHFDWRHHRIDIDAHRVNVINRYDIEHYHRRPFEGRTWEHNPQHRIGVPYRSPQVRERFERKLPGSPQNRYEYRGHQETPSPVRVIPAPGTTERNAPHPGERPAPHVFQRPATPTERVAPQHNQRSAPLVNEQPAAPVERVAPRAAQRPVPKIIQRPATPAERVAPHAVQRPAPQVIERPAAPIYQRSRSGAEAHEYSNRGRASRQSMPAQNPPPPPPPSAPPQGGGGFRGGDGHRR